MERRGIDTIFYYQVDNPLVRIGDPVYIGLHAAAGAELSCKVVRKTDPMEKVGVVVRERGPDGERVTLHWDDRPDEDHYNVYRGEDPALSDLACFASPVFAATLDDDGTVAPGGVYVHLVSAVDQCGDVGAGVADG